MSFGTVLDRLLDGYALTRDGWHGKDQYIKLQRPDENSANTLPYIYFVTAEGDRVPWVASQTDILSDDWELYKE